MIVRRRCAALIPYARNARTHSDQQAAQIAASIREFGFTNPVLIDEEDGIIAGNGRVLAAHLLGLDEVPCIVLAHLTPTQRRAQSGGTRTPLADARLCDSGPACRAQLGDDPRAVVTTTPKPIKIIRELIADPTTMITRGS